MVSSIKASTHVQYYYPLACNMGQFLRVFTIHLEHIVKKKILITNNARRPVYLYHDRMRKVQVHTDLKSVKMCEMSDLFYYH